jgi:hypothetical protein
LPRIIWIDDGALVELRNELGAEAGELPAGAGDEREGAATTNQRARRAPASRGV